MKDYWSTELPKFCTHCGRDMVYKYKKPDGFDSSTGKRPNEHEYYWRCEKIGFWGFLGTAHNEFLVIEQSERMIGKRHYRGVLMVYRGI